MGRGWWSRSRQRRLCSPGATSKPHSILARRHQGDWVSDQVGVSEIGLRAGGDECGCVEWSMQVELHPGLRSPPWYRQCTFPACHTDMAGDLGQRWTDNNTAGCQTPCWGLTNVFSNSHGTLCYTRGNWGSGRWSFLLA